VKVEWFLAFVGAALLMAGACAPESQPSAPPTVQKDAANGASRPTGQPAENAVTRVTVATPVGSQSGYLAALIEAEKIDAKHGLDIENQLMGFTEAANALKLGKAVAAAMQPTSAVALKDGGTDIVLFAPVVWSGNVFLVRQDAPYNSLEELKGKKIGNFSRVTGAFFFSAVIAKEHGLDIEKDFESVSGETAALIAFMERGEVEAINMFEPHVTKMLETGQYRVLLDFDSELERIFGAPPLKTGAAIRRETAEKQPELVHALQAAYAEAVAFIKAGNDEEFFRANAKEFFGIDSDSPELMNAAMKRNRESFADKWGADFFASQNNILQKGIDLGLLPRVQNLEELWVK